MNEKTIAFTDEEISTQELFRGVDLTNITPLLSNSPIKTLRSGETLIAAGHPNTSLYLLLTGQLSIRLGTVDNVPLTTISPGESVGELSLIDRKPTSAFVVAEISSRVLVIDEELLWMLVNSSHAVSSNLLFTLAKRMRFDNDVIYQDRKQLREYRFHAMVDALTGLFNRHWLNKMLPRQLARSRTNEEPLSMLMIDIDYFKRFNDRFGHLAGDHALRSIASGLRENLRASDMAARYGGEEFVVLLPNSTLQDAQRVAERLRGAIAEVAIAFGDGTTLPPLTLSVGAAQMFDNDDVEALLAAADAALYRAKDSGRNCVAI